MHALVVCEEKTSSVYVQSYPCQQEGLLGCQLVDFKPMGGPQRKHDV